MRTPRSLRLALLASLALCAPAAAAPSESLFPDQNLSIVVFRHDTTEADRRRLAQAAGVRIVRELPFIDGMIVELPSVQSQDAQGLQAESAVESMEDNAYRKWIEAEPFGAGFDTPGAAFGAEAGLVLSAARGVSRRLAQDGTPLIEGNIPWGIKRVRAPQEWSRTKGRGVKVGVIDTGIDFQHPDLASNYAGGVNLVDPSSDPMDDNGHGTHVSGTIAGTGQMVMGVAPEASLYAIKVLDADGGGTPETIVEGLQWAADNGMNVVNMSLGGPGTAALARAVKAAYDAGVTVVAAAGNDPKSPVSAPASYPQAIAVSASTKEEKLAFFSTTGPEVAFIAPGHEVISDAPGGKTANHSGTSMATPHVTGLAALAIALGASTPADVRAALTAAAVPMQGLSSDQEGAGMIQADRLGGR